MRRGGTGKEVERMCQGGEGSESEGETTIGRHNTPFPLRLSLRKDPRSALLDPILTEPVNERYSVRKSADGGDKGGDELGNGAIKREVFVKPS